MEESKPEIHKEILLTMFSHIHNLFKKHNIKYWLDGGSLLGAIREGEMISYDDDIDLGVLSKQWGQVIKVLPQLCDDKYKILYQINQDLIKVFVPDMWMKNKNTNKIYGTPTIDIFKWTKANEKIELANPSHRKQFKNCYYNKNELFPLRLYKFNNLPAYGAMNGLPYLFRYYGEDCLTVKKMEVRNETNPILKKNELITI